MVEVLSKVCRCGHRMELIVVEPSMTHLTEKGYSVGAHLFVCLCGEIAEPYNQRRDEA